MNIKNASKLELEDSTYLLYAIPAGGKTHTINFLEGKTLYIPLDFTQGPLKGNANIDIVEDYNAHDAWESWGNLMKTLAKEDLSAYDNIVFDNMSELTRSMLANLGREGNNNRVPSQANYQQIDFFIMDSVRFLQSICKGKRLVFTAWETTDKWDLPSGQQVNRAYPDLRMKIMKNFMGLCNVVGRLVTNPDTGNRGFILTANEYIYAKNQLDDRKYCPQDEIFIVGGKKENNQKGENK